MIGGMLSAPLLSMLVIPAGFLLLRRRQANRHQQPSTQGDPQ
jgi:Cu(I)/Ag(I) efflux system membrane protein CusA/SilA